MNECGKLFPLFSQLLAATNALKKSHWHGARITWLEQVLKHFSNSTTLGELK
jgi:hypothetical protein